LIAFLIITGYNTGNNLLYCYEIGLYCCQITPFEDHMPTKSSTRQFHTPSAYARTHYYYPQEIGSLQSSGAHVSSRRDLRSFLFLIVLTGCGSLRYMNETHELKQGDCAFIDCDRPYAHESDDAKPWELKWVHFYGRDASEAYRFFLSKGLSPVFHPHDPAVFNTILSGLMEIAAGEDPLREMLFHKELTSLVTSCFTESALDDIPSSGQPGDKLDLLRAYFREHYADRLSLDDVGKRFYISKYHLIREYKRRFGITPTADLIGMRISAAKVMLRFESSPVDTVSSLVGFRDTAYFIRVFKRLEGMTPLEYRKKW